MSFFLKIVYDAGYLFHLVYLLLSDDWQILKETFQALDFVTLLSFCFIHFRLLPDFEEKAGTLFFIVNSLC